MPRAQTQVERQANAQGQRLDKHQLHQQIASEIGVPIRDVEMMDGRLSGADFSLNAARSTEAEGQEWIEILEDDSAQAAELVERSHDHRKLRKWLVEAMQGLSGREQRIVVARKLSSPPRTLEALGRELSLSKERVRQLEAGAFQKMRKTLDTRSREVHKLLL